MDVAERVELLKKAANNIANHLEADVTITMRTIDGDILYSETCLYADSTPIKMPDWKPPTLGEDGMPVTDHQDEMGG